MAIFTDDAIILEPCDAPLVDALAALFAEIDARDAIAAEQSA